MSSLYNILLWLLSDSRLVISEDIIIHGTGETQLINTEWKFTRILEISFQEISLKALNL